MCLEPPLFQCLVCSVLAFKAKFWFNLIVGLQEATIIIINNTLTNLSKSCPGFAFCIFWLAVYHNRGHLALSDESFTYDVKLWHLCQGTSENSNLLWLCWGDLCFCHLSINVNRPLKVILHICYSSFSCCLFLLSFWYSNKNTKRSLCSVNVPLIL